VPEPSVAAPAQAPWTSGAAIGRYSLVAKIAVGGMAEIWLARQAGPRGFEKVVVIKKVLEAFTHDPEFVEMFLDEARIAAQLNHPGIVQIYDLGEEAGSYFIAMEYIPGENLAAVVRAGNKAAKPLPLHLGMRMMSGAADALAHAHTKTGLNGKPLDVVHRDVSPQNLIITYDGVLKIVDFGIAKATTRASHTIGNQLKGKLSYLSPEQARGQPVDARSDIFALGILLFEVATRTRLFHFEEPLKALKEIGGEEPLPTARGRNPEVPEALDAIISRALSRDVKARYQTARELQQALEEWLRTWPQPSGTTDVAGYMQELFAERMAQRAQLFEQALHGDLTPSRFPPNIMTGSRRSMPGGTVIERPPARAKRPRVVAAAVIALALGAVAALVWRGGGSRPASPGLWDVTTDPPGAEVSVDGARQGTAPLSLELSPGRHEVVATLAGRQDASRVLNVSGGSEVQHLALALAPAALPPPVAAPATAPAPVPADAMKAKPAGPAAVVRRGKLSLDTSPWTRVFLNGKELGDTPLLEVTVPAGRHVLLLVNDSKNLKRSVEVEIEPGKTTVKKLRL
jgi:serine/threonine protein kinase